MKHLLILLLPAALSGCVVGTVAKTAVTAVTLPVKAASYGVDKLTTSQAEADRNAGRKLRKQDEDRGKLYRDAMQRCRSGRPLPTDDCGYGAQR
jgi:hypothetical protein